MVVLLVVVVLLVLLVLLLLLVLVALVSASALASVSFSTSMLFLLQYCLFLSLSFLLIFAEKLRVSHGANCSLPPCNGGHIRHEDKSIDWLVKMMIIHENPLEFYPNDPKSFATYLT